MREHDEVLLLEAPHDGFVKESRGAIDLCTISDVRNGSFAALQLPVQTQAGEWDPGPRRLDAPEGYGAELVTLRRSAVSAAKSVVRGSPGGSPRIRAVTSSSVDASAGAAATEGRRQNDQPETDRYGCSPRRGGSDSTVTRTCRATGEALLVPARNHRSKVGRITGKTGKSAEDERVAARSAVASRMPVERTKLPAWKLFAPQPRRKLRQPPSDART
jgi:hypothetical protein